MRNIVSAEEIMRSVYESGGDIRDQDISRSKKPIDYVPRPITYDSLTPAERRREVLGEYVRYFTAIHERRKDLNHMSETERQAYILNEAQRCAFGKGKSTR